MPREPPRTSAIHDINCLADGNFDHWDTLDTLYYSLENLRALQINLLLLIPVDLMHGKEEMIKQIAHCLPLLRSRNDLALTFTIEGKPIPWEMLDY